MAEKFVKRVTNRRRAQFSAFDFPCKRFLVRLASLTKYILRSARSLFVLVDSLATALVFLVMTPNNTPELAIPMLTGPGAISTTILLQNGARNVSHPSHFTTASWLWC